MNNFLEELKRYFESKTQIEISENLAKYDVKENNIGPTVEEFLLNCKSSLQFKSFSEGTNIDFSYDGSSLKFSSGFFLTSTFNY